MPNFKLGTAGKWQGIPNHVTNDRSSYPSKQLLPIHSGKATTEVPFKGENIPNPASKESRGPIKHRTKSLGNKTRKVKATTDTVHL